MFKAFIQNSAKRISSQNDIKLNPKLLDVLRIVNVYQNLEKIQDLSPFYTAFRINFFSHYLPIKPVEKKLPTRSQSPTSPQLKKRDIQTYRKLQHQYPCGSDKIARFFEPNDDDGEDLKALKSLIVNLKNICESNGEKYYFVFEH